MDNQKRDDLLIQLSNIINEGMNHNGSGRLAATLRIVTNILLNEKNEEKLLQILKSKFPDQIKLSLNIYSKN